MNLFKRKFLVTTMAATAAMSWSYEAAAKSLDHQLSDALAAASVLDTFEVIVTFYGDEQANTQQLNLMRSHGILGGAMLQNAPMVAAVATKSQIESLYQEEAVRSIWLNSPMTLDNAGSTAITGVDQLRADPDFRINGIPYSGRGIGVVVNDSGIDGTHNDLKFPNHTVQNVLAQTNLQSFSDMAPITYTENVPNTDIAGGHGSHVAGIVGGSGAMSNGKYEGVAPGADLIGYGSGAALFVLDTIGGFDYALTHQYDYNIRVISNSFGNTGDVGTDFNPDDPTNILTKKLSDRGVVVVFSAGNSGNGESTITGNFKKAPWVITVAAGDKSGKLADFSSRGVKGKGGTAEVDGELYEWVDSPSVTAPGVDVISVRDSLSSLGGLSLQDDMAVLTPEELPFYTLSSGTSMSAPHVSGIVALMLEANPNMNWQDVKSILMETATNMPGREQWEVGAGYVNAYAAVQSVLDPSRQFGDFNFVNRSFNAEALTSVASEEVVTVSFLPVGDNPGVPFEVSDEISLISASAQVSENTVALVLESPSGKRYGSGISLPVLGENISVTAEAEAGTWHVKLSGIGGLAGVDVDPVGVGNGYALPGDVDARIKMIKTDGFAGLNDIEESGYRPFIEYGVANRLFDARNYGFDADALLTRGELADYLTMGVAVKQSNDANNQLFNDVDAATRAAVNSVTAIGATLSDVEFEMLPMMSAQDHGVFFPQGEVSKVDLAYALVQSNGLQQAAMDFTGDIVVYFDDIVVVVEDQDQISDDMKGYVQLALDMGLLSVDFSLQRKIGISVDASYVLKAHFNPSDSVNRADAAVAMVRAYEYK